MNTFKLSEKPTHKLYSNSIERKEFVTNKEFALEMSGDSVDLSSSFSELENSFFSKDSKVDKEMMEQLNEFDKGSKEKSENLEAKEDVFVFKKNKEEDTNYTTKPIFMKLETEEFRRNWLCQNCILSENETKRQTCRIF